MDRVNPARSDHCAENETERQQRLVWEAEDIFRARASIAAGDYATSGQGDCLDREPFHLRRVASDNYFRPTTLDFARTKILGNQQEDFHGHVTSFNGGTVSGRFWIDKEEHTVGFSVDRNHRLPPDQRSLLAESLNTWVQQDDGHVIIRGTPLTSKQGSLKQVFITSVRKG
jgi:hypothetical protein